MPKVSEEFPTTFLSALDVMPHGDVALTIASVEPEMMAARPGKPKERKWVLSFRGTKKRLIVSPPVARVIASLHGDEMTGWIGKRVALYVERGVQAFGKRWDCIRVRPDAPPSRNGDRRAAVLDESPDHDPDTGEVYEDAGDVEGEVYQSKYDE